MRRQFGLLRRRNSGALVRLQLFRIESERLKLPAPFSRRIAEPLDADATGQATFYCCFDKVGCEKGERDGHIALPLLHFSRVQSSAIVVIRPETTSSSHRRPRAIALTRRARRLNCSGRTSHRDAVCGSRIWRDLLEGGFCQGIESDRCAEESDSSSATSDLWLFVGLS